MLRVIRSSTGDCSVFYAHHIWKIGAKKPRATCGVRPLAGVELPCYSRGLTAARKDDIVALKLRGRGPATFISYAFGNVLAPQIDQMLRREGFPVTIVDDTKLLGEPSLSAALERLVGESELVVLVLDSAANRSNWVAQELAVAKRLGRVIIPVVEDEATLNEAVRDIPYLTKANVNALAPSALSRYGQLPLDSRNPCQFAPEPLVAYLRSETEFVRTILDSGNVTGCLWESASTTVEQATRAQPQSRTAIEKQVREALEPCIRMLDRADSLLPRFREAVGHALERYGPKRTARSIAPWQRMIRMTIGTRLLAVAEMLPASAYPGYWGEATASIEAASKALQRAPRSASTEARAVWALQTLGDEGPNGWIKASFQAENSEFQGYLPNSGFIADGLRAREEPLQFLEPHQWADFGLPQLFARALLLADRFEDASFTDSIAWNLEDYRSSALSRDHD